MRNCNTSVESSTVANTTFFVVGASFLNDFLTSLGLECHHTKQVPLAIRQLNKLKNSGKETTPTLRIAFEKSNLPADNLKALKIPLINWNNLSNDLRLMLEAQQLPTLEQANLFREELLKLAQEAELPPEEVVEDVITDVSQPIAHGERYYPLLTPQGIKLIGRAWRNYCVHGDYVYRIGRTQTGNEKLIPIGPVATLTRKLISISEEGSCWYVYSIGGVPVTVQGSVFGDIRAWSLELASSGVVRPVKETNYYRHFCDGLRYSENVPIGYFTSVPGWLMPNASKSIDKAIYIWPSHAENVKFNIHYRGTLQKNIRVNLGTAESFHKEVLALLENNTVAYIPLLRMLLGYLAPLLNITPVIFHWVAPTQSGKSSITAVAMAGSGIQAVQNARDSFVSWSSSLAYLMAVAPEFNHSYVVIDEVKNIKAMTGTEVVYNLINGITSGRSNINQTAKSTRSFTATIDSTGERLFAEQLQLKGISVDSLDAGLFTRLADLMLPTYSNSGIFETLPSGYSSHHEFCTELCRSTMSHRGAFAQSWVEYLTNVANCAEESSKLRNEFSEYSKKLISPYIALMPDSLNILTSFAAVDFTFTLAVRMGLLNPSELSLTASEGDFFKRLMEMFEAARNVSGSVDAFENNILKRIKELLSNPTKHDFSVTSIVDGFTTHSIRNPERIVIQETNTHMACSNAVNNNTEAFKNSKIISLKAALPTYHTRYLLTKAEIQIIFNAHSEPLYKRVMNTLIKYKACQGLQGIRLRSATAEGPSLRKRFHEFSYPEEKEDNAEESQLINKQLEMDL